MPAGIVATSPSSPREAIKSMLGLRAASSGVLPPSSSHGQSAMPSPWMMTYFKAQPPLEDFTPRLLCTDTGLARSVVEYLEDLRDVRLDHNRIAQVLHRRVGILE